MTSKKSQNYLCGTEWRPFPGAQCALPCVTVSCPRRCGRGEKLQSMLLLESLEILTVKWGLEAKQKRV